MKKLGLITCLLTIFVLSACRANTDVTTPAKRTVTSTTESTIERSSSSATQEFSSIDSSNVDDVRKETPSDTASVLRRELYQAGINSSTLTDDDLVTYQKEAKEQGKEFKDYVKEKLN